MNAKARIYLLDDDELIVAMIERLLTSEGYEVAARTDPSGAVEEIRALCPALVLLDLKLPGTSGLEILGEILQRGLAPQVVMLSSDGSAESAVQAMKVGAADYVTKPFDIEELKLVVASTLEKRQLRQENEYLRKINGAALAQRELIGSSEAMQSLKVRAAKLAQAGVPVVLITGENGTGKEMLARYIHHLMREETSGGLRPFIGVNCAALPDQLVESELFGHDKGAFTDARTDKKGVFELAAGGSILLDEIGEMKWDLQAKLLRVLEDWKVRRVGGRHEMPIEATVFATTNRDLEAGVKDGGFRIDLFYRLATFALHVPPLRERPEDIVPLANHFLATYTAKYPRSGVRGFSPEAERLLVAHDWPGNAREVRNTVERIVVLEAGPTILPGHLPKEILDPRPRPRPTPPPDRLAAPTPRPDFAFTLPEEGLSMEDLESTLIVQALARTGQNKAQAAKLLGITYDSLRYQIKKMGL